MITGAWFTLSNLGSGTVVDVSTNGLDSSMILERRLARSFVDI